MRQQYLSILVLKIDKGSNTELSISLSIVGYENILCNFSASVVEIVFFGLK